MTKQEEKNPQYDIPKTFHSTANSFLDGWAQSGDIQADAVNAVRHYANMGASKREVANYAEAGGR